MKLVPPDEQGRPVEGSPTFYLQREKGRLQPAPGLSAGKLVGDFRLVSLIGQGGMGQVWEAEQISLGKRHVAVKFVRPERVTARQLELFAREARAGGRLSHPGIVAVHGHGQSDGLTWIAMEFVPGTWTLRDFLDEAARSEEVPEGYDQHVARLVAEIAEAMQVTHEAGVIHRDLKPQNVLVTPDDHPKVTDFGLARISDESAMSETGEFGGTYFYMSPEQVAAKRAGLDHRTDVFSLGVVLYELLTLQRPFQGDTSHQVAAQILAKDPPDPRTLRSRIPRDLAVIAAKAMEKDRDRRYQTMGEFAADLRRHLAIQPIHARPPTIFDRATKWVRRNPTIASAAALFAVAFGIVTWLLVENRAARLRAESSDRATTAALLRAEASDSAKTAALASATQEAARATAVETFITDSLRAASPRPGQGAEYPLREWLGVVAQRLDGSMQDQPHVRAELEGVLCACFASVQDFWPSYEHGKRALALMAALGEEGTPAHLRTLTFLAESIISLRDEFEVPAEMVDEARAAIDQCLDYKRAQNRPGPDIDVLMGMRAYLDAGHGGDKLWPPEAVAYVAGLWKRTDVAEVGDELERKTRRVIELWDAGDQAQATQVILDQATQILVGGAIRLDTAGGRRIAGVFFTRVAKAAYDKNKDAASFCEACFATALRFIEKDEGQETERLSFTALWAELVHKRGVTARALTMLDACVPGLEKRLGLTSNTTVRAGRLFALCLGESGRAEEGLAYVERLRAAWTEKHGQADSGLVPTLRLQADLLALSKRPEEALRSIEAASALPLGTKPEDKLEGLRLGVSRGRILLAANRSRDAEEQLLRTWSDVRAHKLAPARLVSECRSALADLFTSTGRPERAAAYR